MKTKLLRKIRKEYSIDMRIVGGNREFVLSRDDGFSVCFTNYDVAYCVLLKLIRKDYRHLAKTKKLWYNEKA